MGLNNIYHLTHLGVYSLRLKLEDLDGVVEEVNYNKFQLSDQVYKFNSRIFIKS